MFATHPHPIESPLLTGAIQPSLKQQIYIVFTIYLIVTPKGVISWRSSILICTFKINCMHITSSIKKQIKEWIKIDFSKGKVSSSKMPGECLMSWTRKDKAQSLDSWHLWTLSVCLTFSCLTAAFRTFPTHKYKLETNCSQAKLLSVCQVCILHSCLRSC